MSTKAEEQEAGASHGSERSAEQADGSAGAERAEESARTLPSIIVDPGLSELAGAEPSATPGGANGAHVAAAEPPISAATQEPRLEPTAPLERAQNGSAAADDASAGETRFSDEDADCFAANFRPSWEPSAPVPASADAAVRASLPALGPAAVLVPEPELPAAGLAGADLRKRGLLMAGGAVAGFFALVALAFTMSSRSMPNTPPAKSNAQAKVAAAEPAALPANPAPADPGAVENRRRAGGVARGARRCRRAA